MHINVKSRLIYMVVMLLTIGVSDKLWRAGGGRGRGGGVGRYDRLVGAVASQSFSYCRSVRGRQKMHCFLSAVVNNLV